MNIDNRLSKNNTTVAIYKALFHENRDRKKALVSITMGDEKLNSLFALRKKLTDEFKKVLKRAPHKWQKVAYFSNIELGMSKGSLTKGFNPHIHFQFFYDDFTPIEIALNTIKDSGKFENFDVRTSNEPYAFYTYIIKDYMLKNFDEELEQNKMLRGMKKQFYTSSRKDISNYVIKFIYSYLNKHMRKKWKCMEKIEQYEFTTTQIDKGNIVIKRFDDEKVTSDFMIVKKSAILIKTDLT